MNQDYLKYLWQLYKRGFFLNSIDVVGFILFNDTFLTDCIDFLLKAFLNYFEVFLFTLLVFIFSAFEL